MTEPRTVEEVEEAMGLEPGTVRNRGMDACCHYNPDVRDDPAKDCMAASAWHVRSIDDYMFQPCDEHMGRFLANYGKLVLEMHEFSPTCSTEDSWWITGGTETNAGESCCILTQTGVELGVLELTTD